MFTKFFARAALPRAAARKMSRIGRQVAKHRWRPSVAGGCGVGNRRTVTTLS